MHCPNIHPELSELVPLYQRRLVDIQDHPEWDILKQTETHAKFHGGLKKGAETWGKPIWWNDLRPLHASLYFMFAIYAIKKYDKAWIPLFIDTIIGLLAFLQYHFNIF